MAMIGVYFQWFFLPVFNARVAPLFHVDAIDFIKDAYGMRGFTPQQGTTSVILIFGEIVILYLREKALPKIFHNNIAYWLLIVLLIGSIFLTGKRTIAALSLAIPLVIYLLSSGRGMHRVLRLFAVAGILVLGYELLPYLSQSSEFYSIQRFSLTVSVLLLYSGSGTVACQPPSYLAPHLRKIHRPSRNRLDDHPSRPLRAESFRI